MTVVNATGDLFSRDWGFDAIGHGVNCIGSMGAGIAPIFKDKFPRMYHHYSFLCSKQYLLPGQVYPYRVSLEERIVTPSRYVYNIASQYLPGANANYKYLEVGLRYVQFHMREHHLSHLGLPRIGAGIGGLEWDKVQDIVGDIFDKDSIQVTLVSLEGA